MFDGFSWRTKWHDDFIYIYNTYRTDDRIVVSVKVGSVVAKDDNSGVDEHTSDHRHVVELRTWQFDVPGQETSASRRRNIGLISPFTSQKDTKADSVAPRSLTWELHCPLICS